ncbi:TIM23 complex component [Nowakowskiella sp. JEL0078]|nr:TIM23 complex component [Nowakowskiella sp. JEL0078]
MTNRFPALKLNTIHRPFVQTRWNSMKKVVEITAQPAQKTVLKPRHTTTFKNSVANENQVTWTDFFAARKSRRLWERAGGGILGGLGFFGGCMYYYFVADVDPFAPRILGIFDQGTAYTIAPFLVAAVAGTAGISIGGIAWRAKQKNGILRLIDQREKEFYKRISENRPKEVRVAGFNNPMPDYYGEQITSVKEYRAWLKKQRKFAAVTSAGGVVGARIPGMNVNLAGKSSMERTPVSEIAKTELGYNHRSKKIKINIDLSAAMRDDRK